MAWLLILACIYWQVTERMDGQQIYFALIYAKAQIGLFVGLDPEATMVVSFPSREYNVYRYDVANFMQLDAEWGHLTDTVSRGLKLAFLIIFALLAWSFGHTTIEKHYREREEALAQIERQEVLLEEQERYQWEKPKPVAAPPMEMVDSDAQNEFETPRVELLSELINEPEDEDLSPEQQPIEPPSEKPLRLPGRIYRGDE